MNTTQPCGQCGGPARFTTMHPGGLLSSQCVDCLHDQVHANVERALFESVWAHPAQAWLIQMSMRSQYVDWLLMSGQTSRGLDPMPGIT